MTLNHDEALAYVRQASDLQDTIDNAHDSASSEERARIIGRGHGRLGLALKLADVHATLAVADAIEGLRSDLADVPTYNPAQDPMPARVMDRALATVHALDGEVVVDDRRCCVCDSPAVVHGPDPNDGAWYCRLHGPSL